MNCFILLLICLLIIVVLNYDNKIIKYCYSIFGQIKNSCIIPSYVNSVSTTFIRDKNYYLYNHVSNEKLNKLRNIESNDIYISDYVRKFLEMPYDKYFKNIDFNKVENIEI